MKITRDYNTHKFLFGHARSGVIDIDFHLHDGFEIYYLISGDVNYFVEKKIYELKKGDVIITNKSEIHKPHFKSDKTYERIIVQFSKDIPILFGTDNYNLLNCFNNRQKGENNLIRLNRDIHEELLVLFDKLEKTSHDKNPSDKILRNTYLIQILVLLNNNFVNTNNSDINTNIPRKISPILDYINENLNSDLSLNSIEEIFFINKYYFSRLFKKSTGINPHEYIVYKRLAWSKELLAEGYSVTEVSNMTGFNDYANFLRVFKNAIGISPGLYRKFNLTAKSPQNNEKQV